jgi:tetratricopeptide (TPR) repeat protein
MSLFSEFFLYAAVFRLAIIAAGTVSLMLGYRLFTVGIRSEKEDSNKTTFNAKIAGLTFALKNAAPGTFFALFGVIIISVMLVQGNPELTLKSVSDAQRAAGLPESSELTLRGGASASIGKFDDAVQRGLEYDRKRDTANAVASYEEAMTDVATPMNQLAWDYLQQGKAESALPLARLAVQLCPGKAPFLDTLAEILFKMGELDEALKWMEKAAALDSKYQDKLSDYRRAAKR